ncbi:MAG: hypothetical protein LQ350_008256, partial [Teloschistes chrysophthalmus]
YLTDQPNEKLVCPKPILKRNLSAPQLNDAAYDELSKDAVSIIADDGKAPVGLDYTLTKTVASTQLQEFDGRSINTLQGIDYGAEEIIPDACPPNDSVMRFRALEKVEESDHGADHIPREIREFKDEPQASAKATEPNKMSRLANRALLTSRNATASNTINVVTGVIGATFGGVGCAAAVTSCYLHRKSIRDKSQADIQLDELRSTRTQELNRREAALQSRSQQHAATEERLERRHQEQRRNERALDMRSRVNDARQANIRGDTGSGRSGNEQVKYPERGEVDLYERIEEVNSTKTMLSGKLKALAKVKEAQGHNGRKSFYKTAVLQEFTVALKSRTLKRERKEFERIMRPIREVKAMKQQMQATEEMRKKEFEKALRSIQDQESNLAVQQGIIDSNKETLMIEPREAMEQWQANQKGGSQLKEGRARLEKEKANLGESKAKLNRIADELDEIKADLNRWGKSVHRREVDSIIEDRRLQPKAIAVTAQLADMEAKEKEMQGLQKEVAEGIDHLKKLDRR